MTSGDLGRSSGGPLNDSDSVDLPVASLLRGVRTRSPRALHLGRRHRRPPRPSTVWPCALDDFHQGPGVIADWLMSVVIKAVTTYTQPGQRVLLLTPFAGAAGFTQQVGVRPPSPYAGLLEAGWLVARLGRGIQTRAAGAPGDVNDDLNDDDSIDSATDADSGGTPRSNDSASLLSAHGRIRPSGAVGVLNRDRFDLIIIATEPRALSWLDSTGWTDLLSESGVLAIVTHSDRSRGLLSDAAELLLTAAHRAGLWYCDRIALLPSSVRHGAHADSHEGFRIPCRTATTSVHQFQGHHDLLVFVRHPGRNVAKAGGDVR